MGFDIEISEAIFNSFSSKFRDSIKSDVVIAGAGPSGLLCAGILAKQGLKVTILEKRLAPGGGIWGGAMGMPEIIVEKECKKILEEIGIKGKPFGKELLVVSAFELAAALVVYAIKCGAIIHNLTYLEDLVVIKKKVCGVVVNRTFVGETLPIDPLTLECKAVVDATGHEAQAANLLSKRGLIKAKKGDGVMNAISGEDFVVKHSGSIYPGLYLTGMSVCSYFGGPRMGPIFGGMLKSGEKVAKQILKDLKK